MKWSRVKRDARLTILGEKWWIPVLGAIVVFLYNVAMIGGGSISANFGPMAYAGGVLGGLLAGSVLGTNAYDAAMAGFRAAVLGMAAIAVLATISTFIAWYMASGLAYFYVSTFVGVVTFFFLMPVYAFTGALSGALGVFLRRMVVPQEYNPPAY